MRAILRRQDVQRHKAILSCLERERCWRSPLQKYLPWSPVDVYSMPHVNSQDQVGKLSEKTPHFGKSSLCSYWKSSHFCSPHFCNSAREVHHSFRFCWLHPATKNTLQTWRPTVSPSKLLDLTQLASPDVQVSSFGASLISASSLASTS